MPHFRRCDHATNCLAYRRRLAAGRWLAAALGLAAWLCAAGPASAQESPALTAIILLPDETDIDPPAPGVDLSQVHVPDAGALRRHLSRLLGQTISPETLGSVKQAIFDDFKAAGHPFLDVSFPPQDVATGVLHVVVREYRLGQVTVKGNRWFADGFIRSQSGLEAGSPLDKARLDLGMAELNANPFLKVSPVMMLGDTPGTINIALRAQDRFPVDILAGYSNTGAPTTGWDRWTLGAVWGDALHLGQTLSYQFVSSSDLWHHLATQGFNGLDPSFQAHLLTWQVPLPWGDALVLGGAYERERPLLGPSVGAIGVTLALQGEYIAQLGALPLGPDGANHQAGFGFSYKRTNNELAFGGATVQPGFTEIDEFLLDYGAVLPFAWGALTFDNVLFASPGHLTSDNTNAAFQPSDMALPGTPGASARYVYDRVALTQTIGLPAETSLVLRATAQEATTTLLPSEQLSIAGANAVRGYQEFGLAGSRGVLTSVEFRLPSFSPMRLLAGWEANDVAQPHLFFDQGEVWNPISSAAAPRYLHSESAGIGGRYQIGRYFSLQIDEGWQIVRAPRQGANGAFLHIAATATW